MGKSKRKTMIVGHTCCESEKDDKRRANRKLRRANKVRLDKGEELLDLREVSNPWEFGKDGKGYVCLDDIEDPTYRRQLESK